jgi:hypothetical protein
MNNLSTKNVKIMISLDFDLASWRFAAFLIIVVGGKQSQLPVILIGV